MTDGNQSRQYVETSFCDSLSQASRSLEEFVLLLCDAVPKVEGDLSFCFPTVPVCCSFHTEVQPWGGKVLFKPIENGTAHRKIDISMTNGQLGHCPDKQCESRVDQS